MTQGFPPGTLEPRLHSLAGKRITLRGYQQKAKDEIKQRYAMGVRRCLLVIPTGGGKTIVFSDIAYDVAANFKRVLILAHRVELLEQCGDKLEQNGVDFGYLNPKYTANRMSRVQVGTMQTVVNRLDNMDAPDLIIIDEAHRSMSKTYQTIVAKFPKARLLGVTATPIRGDGRALGDMYEDMVVGSSIEELIGMGALVRPTTYAPLGELDLKGVKTVAGDWEKGGLAKAMNKPHITGKAVAHYKAICPGAKAVVFCVRVEHARDVARDFREAGYLFEHIDGDMPKEDVFEKDAETGEFKLIQRGRTSILNDLRDGKIHGITSVDLVTEGLDIPAISCAIMLRPTKSEGLYLQMAGRILRPFPGKEFAIVLDHAGLTLKHGLVTEFREWTIDPEQAMKRAKANKEKGDRIKQCPKCYLNHEVAPVCPKCGHVYKAEAHKMNEREGTLEVVTVADAKRIEAMRKKKEIGMAKTLDDLKRIERERQYKGRHPFDDIGKPVAGWAETVWAAKNKKGGSLKNII